MFRVHLFMEITTDDERVVRETQLMRTQTLHSLQEKEAAEVTCLTDSAADTDHRAPSRTATTMEGSVWLSAPHRKARRCSTDAAAASERSVVHLANSAATLNA